MLLLGHAEVGDALRIGDVDETGGAVVVDESGRGGRRGARAAVRANVGVGFQVAAGAAKVADLGADVGTDFDGQGIAENAEIAPEVIVGLARRVVSALAVTVGGNERVAVEIRGIDDAAVGISDGDFAGAEVKDLVEVDRDVVALEVHAVEAALVDIQVVNAGAAVSDAGIGFPNRAVVQPAQGRCVSTTGADTAAVAHSELAGVNGSRERKGAQSALGTRGRPIAGHHAVDLESLRACREIFLQHAVREAERDAVVARAEGTPVHGGR